MKFNWGTGILVFIILFLLISAVVIIFSLRQNHDLVESDYYEKGANYTDQIKINERSLPYQDSVTIMESDNSILITTESSMHHSGNSMEVYFFRPSDKSLDYKVDISNNNDTITVDKSKLVHGRYIVNLNWKVNGEQFQVKKDILIK